MTSTLPAVGGTLPALPGLDGLTSVLSTVPVVGGADLTSVLADLPPLPIAGAPDLLAGLTSSLPALTALSEGLPAAGLPAGTVPTGSALAPVTGLLRQVAAAAAGTPLGAALVGLADQIDAAGDGGVSPDLLSVLASTLGSIANTPGVPTEVRTIAGTLASQLAPKAAAKPVATKTLPAVKPVVTAPAGNPAATAPAVGRARLAGLRIDRKTGRVRVVLACPASGAACKTIVVAYRGGSLGPARHPRRPVADYESQAERRQSPRAQAPDHEVHGGRAAARGQGRHPRRDGPAAEVRVAKVKRS